MSDQDKIKRLLDHGLTCYGLGQVEEALSIWREVLDMEPGNPRAIEYIQFVESNWTPSQPRETQPYRPDESSDKIDVSDVPVPTAATKPEAAAAPKTEPEAAAAPKANPAPAPGPFGEPPPKIFVEPFKPGFKPGAWGDLYDFDKKAVAQAAEANTAEQSEQETGKDGQWSVWTPGPGDLPDPVPLASPPIASPKAMPSLVSSAPAAVPAPRPEAAIEATPAPAIEATPAPAVEATPAPAAFPPKPMAPALPPKPPVPKPALAPEPASAESAADKPSEPAAGKESPPGSEPVEINPVPPFAKSAGPSSGGALDLVGSNATPAWAPETPRPAKSLLQGAKDMLELDDFSGAVELLEKAHQREPDNDEVRHLLMHAQGKLDHHLRGKIGDTQRCPRVRMSGDEIIWLNLDSRAGFLLSLMDGHTNVDDLLSICGLPALDALRIMAQLIEEKVIAFD